MNAIRDIRRKARRDLHLKAQVPAFYLRTREAEPVLCHVRLHDKFLLAGKISGNSGSGGFGAQIEDEVPEIRFDLTEIPDAERKGIVSFLAGEAYIIDRMKAPDDQFRTAIVTRMSEADAEGLPVPDPDA